MGILTKLWNDILERFNCISKKLQSVQIDLTTVVSLYKSLINYIGDLRNSFSFYEKLGKEKSGVEEYKIERKRKKKMTYGESNQDNPTLQQSDSFRINTFIVILDSLLTELNKRKNAYDTGNIKFGFLFNLTKLPLSKVRESKENKLHSCNKNIQRTLVNHSLMNVYTFVVIYLSYKRTICR